MAEKLITDEYDEKVTKSELPVLLDFYADWCGPCKMLSPVIEQIGEEYKGKVSVYKVNVDEEPVLAKQFGIMSIPTLVLLKDGREEKKLVGLRNKNEIAEILG